MKYIILRPSGAGEGPIGVDNLYLCNNAGTNCRPCFIFSYHYLNVFLPVILRDRAGYFSGNKLFVSLCAHQGEGYTEQPRPHRSLCLPCVASLWCAFCVYRPLRPLCVIPSDRFPGGKDTLCCTELKTRKELDAAESGDQ